MHFLSIIFIQVHCRETTENGNTSLLFWEEKEYSCILLSVVKYTNGCSRSQTFQKGEHQQCTQDGARHQPGHAQLFKMYGNEEADGFMDMYRVQCSCVKKWESIPSKLDCCVKKIIQSGKKTPYFWYISPKNQRSLNI